MYFVLKLSHYFSVFTSVVLVNIHTHDIYIIATSRRPLSMHALQFFHYL